MAGDDDVRLPLVPGPVSNGEFLPLAAAPADVRLARAVLDRAAAAADALAMDRRLFLQTAGGMAALLTTINLAACSSAAHTIESSAIEIGVDAVGWRFGKLLLQLLHGKHLHSVKSIRDCWNLSRLRIPKPGDFFQ